MPDKPKPSAEDPGRVFEFTRNFGHNVKGSTITEWGFLTEHSEESLHRALHLHPPAMRVLHEWTPKEAEPEPVAAAPEPAPAEAPPAEQPAPSVPEVAAAPPPEPVATVPTEGAAATNAPV